MALLTKKREYVKPAMQVYEMLHQPQLLAGSAGLNDYSYPDSPYTW